MDYKTVVFECDHGVAIAKLNRPKQLNSISNEMFAELYQIADRVAADDDIAVLIITGSSKVFAAGADLKEVGALKGVIDAHKYVSNVHKVFNRIEKLEKPVIAAVGGLALGGGCELALACDIRIAAENAKFGLPEIKIGALPGGGGTQRLPRLIGSARAKEMLFLGDPVDALEAYRIGLANKVVPDDLLMETALEMAAKIAKRPGYALKISKIAVNDGIRMDLDAALTHEARCFEILFATNDIKEGIGAFIEKRKPEYSGT